MSADDLGRSGVRLNLRMMDPLLKLERVSSM